MIIVGDIGGTHARFACVDARAGALERIEVLRCDDHADLPVALAAYLAAHALPSPDRLVLAVAGPVRAGAARITNNDWLIGERDLQQRLPGCAVRLVNDFEAIAAAIPALGEADIVALNSRALPDRERRPARIAVLGPGTGLGAALLVRGAHGDEVLASEAGHLPVAWRDDAERAALATLSEDLGELAWDHLASGRGGLRIAGALGLPSTSSQDVFTAARARDAGAERCLAYFHGLLARAAQSLVLATGAWDGLLLCGGLLGEHADLLAASDFEAVFDAHQAHGALLAAVPLGRIAHPQPGLLGAAQLALDAR